MKRIVTIAALVLCCATTFGQQVASRAKAMRMMNFSRPEYQIKDIKVYTDTMTVYSLSADIIYPLGVWTSVEQYITDNQLSWYREIGYQKYMSKDDVFKVFFKKYPKSYTSDVAVLKVVSGANEVAEIYTFKGQKLRHIKIETAYKYY